MNIQLETYLFDNIRDTQSLHVEAMLPRNVIMRMIDEGMIASAKQAWRTLEKWNRKGLYEYGVSLDLGWKLV